MATTDTDVKSKVKKDEKIDGMSIRTKYKKLNSQLKGPLLELIELTGHDAVNHFFSEDKAQSLLTATVSSREKKYVYAGSEISMHKAICDELITSVDIITNLSHNIKSIADKLSSSSKKSDSLTLELANTLGLVQVFLESAEKFPAILNAWKSSRILAARTKPKVSEIKKTEQQFHQFHQQFFAPLVAYCETVLDEVDETLDANNAVSVLSTLNDYMIIQSTVDDYDISDLLQRISDLKIQCESLLNDILPERDFSKEFEKNKNNIIAGFIRIVTSIPTGVDIFIERKKLRQFHQDNFKILEVIKGHPKLNKTYDSLYQSLNQEAVYFNVLAALNTLALYMKSADPIDENILEKHKAKIKEFSLAKEHKELLATTVQYLTPEKPEPSEPLVDKEVAKRARMCIGLIRRILALKPEDSPEMTKLVVEGTFDAISSYLTGDKLSFLKMPSYLLQWRKIVGKYDYYDDEASALCEILSAVSSSTHDRCTVDEDNQIVKFDAEKVNAEIKYGDYFLEYSLQQIFTMLKAGNPMVSWFEDKTLYIGGFKSKLIEVLSDFVSKYDANSPVVKIKQKLFESSGFLNFQVINNEFIPEFLHFAEQWMEYKPVDMSNLAEDSAFRCGN